MKAHVIMKNDMPVGVVLDDLRRAHEVSAERQTYYDSERERMKSRGGVWPRNYSHVVTVDVFKRGE